MLKQSLIQEKLSDLAVASSSSTTSVGQQTGNVVNAKLSGSKSAKTMSSSSTRGDFAGGGGSGVLDNPSFLNINTETKTSNDSLLPHMPQWPRVQIGTQQIQSNLNGYHRSSRGNLNTIYPNTNTTNTSAKTSPTSSAAINTNRRNNVIYSANTLPVATTYPTAKNEELYD